MAQGKPNSPMSVGQLTNAVQELGSWDDGRQMLVDLLLRFEAKAAESGPNGVDVRETVTGPILDAAYGHGRPFSKTLNSGLTISARYTSKILRDFIMGGERPDHVWEPQTTKTLLALTADARNVVIGGAYIGDHAILIADQIRNGGKVHCFELSEENTSLLRKNALQNELQNVEINEIGLWSEPNVRLSLEGDDSHATPRVSAEGFPATTIEAYAHQKGFDKLDLIMLDIEGGELAALKGAERFLTKPAGEAPHVVFEIHGSYTDWSNGLRNTDIVEHLTARGYEVLAIRDYHSNVDMAGKLVELVDCESAYIDGPVHGFNMLATKRMEDLNPALFRRVSGVSPKLLRHRDPILHAPIL